MGPRKRVATPKNDAEKALKAAARLALERGLQASDLIKFGNAVADTLDNPRKGRATIERMVNAAAHDRIQESRPGLGLDTSDPQEFTDDGLPIFASRDEMPTYLIDVPTAQREFGLSSSTIGVWVKRKKIAVQGRLKSSARGGGILVVKKADIRHCLNNPRPTGRPRKTV